MQETFNHLCEEDPDNQENLGERQRGKLAFNIKEAERITGLGRTTLWKAINEGQLKCYKVGRRVLFSLEHLKLFLELHEKQMRDSYRRSGITPPKNRH
jgi:excisionase family DNA binding protein